MPLRRLIALIVDTHHRMAKPYDAEPPPSRSVSVFSKRKSREDRALGVPSQPASSRPQMTRLERPSCFTLSDQQALVLRQRSSCRTRCRSCVKAVNPWTTLLELPNRSLPGNNRIVPLHNVKQPANEPRPSSGTAIRRKPLSFRMRTSRRARLAEIISSSLFRAPQAEAMVEPDGIEPTTSCLQSTRSPS